MKFLEDVVQAREMKVSDVMIVAQWYHKYGFTGGLSLCDVVLRDFVRATREAEAGESTSPDVDAFVDALVLADAFNLASRKVGVAYLEAKLVSSATPYGLTMFEK